MHVHMHAPNHLLTLTNMRVTGRTLHQPRDLTSPDSHSPAYRAPQAFRPPEGRRSAAAKRCRGGRSCGRWGGCGGSKWLRARASRRGWRMCFAQLQGRAQEAPAAARTPQGGRAVATLAPLVGPPRGRRQPTARGARCSPVTASVGDRPPGPCSPATLGMTVMPGTHREGGLGRWYVRMCARDR